MPTRATTTTTERTMTEATPGEPGALLRRALVAARRQLASIRVRIVVGYIVLLAVGLAVAIIVTRQVQHARADREIEREQAQEMEELGRLAGGRDPQTGEPFGDDVEAIFTTFLDRNVPSDDEAFYTIVDGRPFEFSSASPPLFDDPQFLRDWNVRSPTEMETTTEIGGVGTVRSLAVPIFAGEEVAGVFVVASFPADDHGEVDQVVRVIALAGTGVLLVSVALAWSLAGRVLRPVRTLTSTAKQITESDLSARIPVEGKDELAELGDTFNEMVERLDVGFRSQRRFLDDVAHELRTPITIVRGHLEVLGDAPEERAETIDMVTDELDRMSRYVSDLLVLAQAEQPDFLVPEAIDLGELAVDLRNRVRAIGERAWVLDAAPAVGTVTVTADRDRLVQAVVNLATNAVQHTEDGAEIGVGAHFAAGRARLWVRDSGPGIDPAIARTLFDRTSRSANSRARRPEGTGIGLSIVEAIARAHGGSVAVEPSAATGATFVITLPHAETTGWSPPRPSPPPPPPTTVGGSVTPREHTPEIDR
jgi:signal transduction histidine kinase